MATSISINRLARNFIRNKFTLMHELSTVSKSVIIKNKDKLLGLLTDASKKYKLASYSSCQNLKVENSSPLSAKPSKNPINSKNKIVENVSNLIGANITNLKVKPKTIKVTEETYNKIYSPYKPNNIFSVLQTIDQYQAKKKQNPCGPREQYKDADVRIPNPCLPKKDASGPKEEPCGPKKSPSGPKKNPCAPKRDPSGRKKDPCGPKTPDPCAPKKRDPCAPKKRDPCAPKKPDPCAPKKSDPCAPKKRDPCGPKKSDPCAPKKRDPCAPKKSDPCAPKKRDPCAPKKNDPCAPKKSDPCAPKKKDPCTPIKPRCVTQVNMR